MKEPQWSRETPYHVARIPGRGHYAIECHQYGVDLMGSLAPRQTFETFAEAKAAAEKDHQRRTAA